MKNFIYMGSQPHNSTILVDEDNKKKEVDVRLAPGDEQSLDEAHPVIKSLIETGLLVESTTGKQLPQSKSKQ